MSAIDERVVQMRFDNEKFNSNIGSSISALDKLKAALKLDGASKGLSEVEAFSSRFSMDGIAYAVDAIAGRFSTMGIIGVRALTNIVDKAMNAGERLVKAMSIDQINAGWTKYADKTTSVQTIMAATAETWEKSANSFEQANYLMSQGLDESMATKIAQSYQEVASGATTLDAAAKALGVDSKYFSEVTTNLGDVKYAGSQMEYVNSQMEKLNWFTDETSYNFVDMVSNIGKFTSNNIDLDTAVTSMQGIANWAAISGQNAGAASRAMYNLSQALGVGSVKLMDWRSIENANMATSEFKQQVLDAAVANNTLTKSVDSSGKAIYKTAKGTEVSVESFSQTLSEGWFDKNTLITVLDQYGSFTNQLYDFSEATGLTATEILKLIDANEANELSTQKLTELAKDAGMSYDEFKESLDNLGSSENEFGRKTFKAAQEAKTFADAIDATKDAASTAWMNIFETIFGDYEKAKVLWTNFANFLYDTLVSPLEKVQEVLDHWAGFDGPQRIISSLSAVWKFLVGDGEEAVGILSSIKEAFREVFPDETARNLLAFTLKFEHFAKNLKLTDEQAANIKSTFKGIFSIFKFVGNAISSLWKATKPLRTALGTLAGAILKVIASIGDWISGLDSGDDKVSLFEKAVTGLASVITWVANAISNFSFGDTIGKAVDWLREKFKAFTEYLSGLDWGKMFKRGAGVGVLGLLGAKIVKVFKNMSSGGLLSTIKEKLGDVLDNLSDAIKTFQNSVKVDMLLKIAAAIGIMALSLLVLGFVDYEKASYGFIMIGTALTALIFGLTKITKVNSKIAVLAGSLVAIAAAFAIFAVGLIVLAGAIALFTLVGNMEGVDKGLGILFAALLMVIPSMLALSKLSPKVFIAAAALIAFAAAMAIFAGVIALFALVANMEHIAEGLVFFAITLIAALGALAVLSQMSPMVLVGVTALVLLSGAMLLLAGAIAAFAAIAGMKNAWQGVAMLGASLAILIVALMMFGSMGPTVLLGAGALLVAAAACIALAVAVGIVGLALPLLAYGLEALVVAISNSVIALGDAVAAFGTDLGLAIAGIGEGIGLAIEAILSSIGEGIANGIIAINDSITGFGDSIAGLGDGVTKFGDGIRSLSGISWTSTAAGVLEISAALKNLNKNIDGEALTGIADGVVAICTTMVDSIMSVDPMFVESGSTIGTNFGNSLLSGFESLGYRIRSAGSAIGSSAASSSRNYTGFYNAGSSSASGYIDGLLSQTGKAAAAGETLAARALEAAKKKLDINSPSREFRSLGVSSGEGLVYGMDDMGASVEKASSSMVGGAYNSAKLMLSKVLDLLDSDVSLSPTITPVLDLSSVRSGASEIDSMLGKTEVLNVEATTSRISGIAANVSTSSRNGIITDETRSNSSATSYNFTQNNYSPKSLSRADIYRQTKNQFSMLKGSVNNRA